MRTLVARSAVGIGGMARYMQNSSALVFFATPVAQLFLTILSERATGKGR